MLECGGKGGLTGSIDLARAQPSVQANSDISICSMKIARGGCLSFSVELNKMNWVKQGEAIVSI